VSTESVKTFNSFAEFYPYYLQEHSNDTCRRLHYVGSLLVLSILAYAIPACRRALSNNKPTTLETPFEPMPAGH